MRLRLEDYPLRLFVLRVLDTSVYNLKRRIWLLKGIFGLIVLIVFSVLGILLAKEILSIEVIFLKDGKLFLELLKKAPVEKRILIILAVPVILSLVVYLLLLGRTILESLLLLFRHKPLFDAFMESISFPVVEPDELSVDKFLSSLRIGLPLWNNFPHMRYLLANSEEIVYVGIPLTDDMLTMAPIEALRSGIADGNYKIFWRLRREALKAVAISCRSLLLRDKVVPLLESDFGHLSEFIKPLLIYLVSKDGTLYLMHGVNEQEGSFITYYFSRFASRWAEMLGVPLINLVGKTLSDMLSALSNDLQMRVSYTSRGYLRVETTYDNKLGRFLFIVVLTFVSLVLTSVLCFIVKNLLSLRRFYALLLLSFIFLSSLLFLLPTLLSSFHRIVRAVEVEGDVLRLQVQNFLGIRRELRVNLREVSSIPTMALISSRAAKLLVPLTSGGKLRLAGYAPLIIFLKEIIEHPSSLRRRDAAS